MIPVEAGCMFVTAVPNMNFLRPTRSSISSLPTSERLMRMRGYISKSTAFDSPSHLGVTAPSRELLDFTVTLYKPTEP
jgi:hypothetical protein